MAGYTRQSVPDIINGADITAPPLNAEFNQLAAAFNNTTGHAHDGTTGNGPKISLTAAVSGVLPTDNGGTGGRYNLSATTNPTATADSVAGYAPGALWLNTATGRIFICANATSNAAVWLEIVGVANGNTIAPTTTNTVDFGTSTVRYKNLFLSGSVTSQSVFTGSVSADTASVSGTSTFAGLVTTNGGILNNGVFTNTGTFNMNGNVNIGDAAGDTVTVTARVASNLVPNADDQHDLGLSTNEWRNLWIDGTANIDNLVADAATISAGSIDGTAIGATNASTIRGTNITATTGFSGNLTGNVTGTTTGTHIGPVTGAVTGDVNGNIISAGTSTFNNVTISGTLDLNAGTVGTITGLSAPANASDAATKSYVDSQISGLISSAPGVLDTLNEIATALGNDPNFATSIATELAKKLDKTGGTMTGAINMGSNKITALGTPTVTGDAATKGYVDTADGLKLDKAGGLMSGAIAMGGNKVTGLAAPTDTADATTKGYVDGILGSATSAAASAAAAATSATNTATNASAAATSASQAEAALDSFDDRYLGPKASDPTVDNDGNALLIGALYFNTVSNEMRVRSGSGWMVAYLPASGYQLLDADLTAIAELAGTSGLLRKTAANTYELDTAAYLSTVSLTADVTGTLPAPKGGTGLTSPGASGNILTSNGTAWVSGAAPSSIVVSETAPESPAAGTVWWKSDTGVPYIYYNDGDTSQWVTFSVGPAGKDGTNGTNGADGAARYPQNIQSANYTVTLGDAGKQIFHPASDANVRTYTIPSNASVAYPIGTVILFTVENGGVPVSVAINSDTLVSGSGTTGSVGVPANNTLMCIKVTATKWMANYLNQADITRYQVALATWASPAYLLTYPWNSGAGFGTQYANPTTPPTGALNGVAFSPLANAIAVANQASPFLDAYGWSSSGFGTKFTNPATLPTGVANQVAFSPSGNSIAVAHDTTPFISAYPWGSSGFGTKYANPTTLPAFNGLDVAFSPDGNSIAVGHINSPSVTAYPWNSTTGFGTKFANPATLPAQNGRKLAFSPAGDALAVAQVTAPFAVVYPWNSATGFGTRYSNPTTAISANIGYSVAFHPTGNAIVVGLDSNVSGVIAYAWSSAGWGARLANTNVFSAGPINTIDLTFAPEGNAIILSGYNSDGSVGLVRAYRWTSTGFGAIYDSSPSVANYVYGAAFNSSF